MSRLILPRGLPSDYKSFSIAAPRTTHWLPATCEQVGCEQWRKGFWTELDTRTPEGRFNEHYVRNLSGRAFQQVLERPDGEPLPAGFVRFEFPPGQQCFDAAKHKIRKEEVGEIFSTRIGDWRSHSAPQNCSADGWVNQFLENDERLKRQYEATRE